MAAIVVFILYVNFIYKYNGKQFCARKKSESIAMQQQ